jgi:IS4 transposase
MQMMNRFFSVELFLSSLALFIWLIIRLIQLVFSAGTIFFSHEKSVNSVFQPAYNSSRTAPLYLAGN